MTTFGSVVQVTGYLTLPKATQRLPACGVEVQQALQELVGAFPQRRQTLAEAAMVRVMVSEANWLRSNKERRVVPLHRRVAADTH